MPYAETCSVTKQGAIILTSCSYGYTPGWIQVPCQTCVNGGYTVVNLYGLRDAEAGARVRRTRVYDYHIDAAQVVSRSCLR